MGFDEAAAELALAIEGEVEPRQGAWECVLESLSRLLTAWFGTSLTVSDRADVVSDAVKDFVQAIRNGTFDSTRSPAAYLTTIARNAGKDHLRRSSRVVPTDPNLVEQGGDIGAPLEGSAEFGDMADELLDRVDSVQSIALAMVLAKAAGDHECNAAVQVWLSMSEQEGRHISTREVAAKMDISHTEVGRRLARFRSYLEVGPSAITPDR